MGKRHSSDVQEFAWQTKPQPLSDRLGGCWELTIDSLEEAEMQGLEGAASPPGHHAQRLAITGPPASRMCTEDNVTVTFAVASSRPYSLFTHEQGCVSQCLVPENKSDSGKETHTCLNSGCA